MRVRHFLTGTILLAGCYSHPETTPHPHTVIVAGAPKRVAGDSSKRTPTTATAPAPSAPVATASGSDAGATMVSTTDVTKGAIDIFGDSLAAAPAARSDSIEEPTWDMDVRSYETQERVAHYVNMFT